ncbi:MAG: hypothetical protein MUF24_06785 [Chitinophagaceae bacterium]|nr:hypothetical protein [Chitinophagaceae bacterium]
MINSKITMVLLALATLANMPFLFAQPAQNTSTELFIIGTLHTGNKYIDHNTLYNTLYRLKPDVILWEYNKDFKPIFGLRTAKFLRLAKVEIEQLALQKYAKRERFDLIFGFDTLIPQRKLYRKSSSAIEDELLNTLNETFMDTADAVAFSNYASKSNFYTNYIANSGLVDINRLHIIDSCRTVYKWDREIIIPLGKKYISDTLLVNNYIAESDFWVARNEYMVKKIQQMMDKYPGKRFVVFTGLSHKYFLTDALLADTQRNFVLKELAAQ